ncbi:MAG: SH3 domain-containing protein [Gammaproteobacteria bacterium]|uniref:SH3 domain-containing protein n=1 Tax=Rhodoferax sp. TaxID=50421 RepID=UPI0018561F0A|nr:SH3 domain-containing protein [Rhodoferax sp.]MBU3900968.1 SH3 domain-containing protein [Gammaproteobacteria bacterium]MBA3056471.1 SH3 domain-containing protein [Rhodoferax sp.]MBU3996803.1 SH3 domain-containing protein [Gammaproteobacteria bacterium]MBU4017642.1 SH3 domain-containing protein [Gammaproteobacteria bacterium]MBU4081085.1 SH3 domain-containing protein [Gammaproteobacteria bacterium]
MSSLKYLFALLVALVSLGFAPALQARDMVSVARPEINMRTGASTRHSVVWALSKGYPLEVIARKGKWLKVRDFEKDSGWVSRPLVNKTPHVIVKSSISNVRSEPSTRGRILGKAPYGEVLRTLEHRDDWVKVQRDGGLKGWISRRLVWGW